MCSLRSKAGWGKMKIGHALIGAADFRFISKSFYYLLSVGFNLFGFAFATLDQCVSGRSCHEE